MCGTPYQLAYTNIKQSEGYVPVVSWRYGCGSIPCNPVEQPINDPSVVELLGCSPVHVHWLGLSASASKFVSVAVPFLLVARFGKLPTHTGRLVSLSVWTLGPRVGKKGLVDIYPQPHSWHIPGSCWMLSPLINRYPFWTTGYQPVPTTSEPSYYPVIYPYYSSLIKHNQPSPLINHNHNQP